jgi:hypothetical protein
MAGDGKNSSPLFAEAVKDVLRSLPARRMRDVMERRFGLKGRKPETLDAVGKGYRITRERVRQIEASALAHLAAAPLPDKAALLVQRLGQEIESHGGAIAEHHLYGRWAERRHYPHIRFLLHITPSFHRVPETDLSHARWTTDTERAALGERVSERVVAYLKEHPRLLTREEMRHLFRTVIKEVTDIDPSEKMIDACLASSKPICQNPFGDYGLTSWPLINPRGIKDKAYAALFKEGKPMHFREIAGHIAQGGWSGKKKVHLQTVHNELIKDPRFVLMGRGTYALREWGFEGGVLRDVLVSVLHEAGRPLTKEEIIDKTLAKRLVKPPTVLLNLHNRSLFKRTEDGKYMLA